MPGGRAGRGLGQGWAEGFGYGALCPPFRTPGQGRRWALRSAHVAPLRPGLQRRRLIPAPLPDAVALGHKPGLPGQWVDLPPPLAGSRKEPFEIKVYEIDDVERLQRHRPAPRGDPAQVSARTGQGRAGGRRPWHSGSWGCGRAACRRHLSLLSTALPGRGEGRSWPSALGGPQFPLG